MPEHDAFGRPIGEDPLAALRGTTEPDVPRAAPEPAVPRAAPEPAVPRAAPGPHVPRPAPEPAVDTPPGAPPRIEFIRAPRRRRPGFRALVVAIALLTIGVGAIPALVGVATDEVGDRIDDLVPPTAQATDPPSGLEGASLIRRARFAEAIATLRDAEIGRPVQMRVAPERIDAALIDARGGVHQVQLTFDGTLNRFSTSSGGADVPTVPYDRIDPAAPERLVRRGAKRVHTAAGEIDYLVVNAGQSLLWGAYFKGGGIVQGDARGRPRRVVSE